MFSTIKRKVKEWRASAYFPVMVFTIALLLFYLLFTRLMIKTDDGNFLGTAFEPGFRYRDFLATRYLHLSGRTVSEFLVMFFIRRNLIWWKLLCTGMYGYIACFFCRLAAYFSPKKGSQNLFAYCCFSLFFMILSCLNPSAFWYSGSFTYLLAFFGLTGAVKPLVIYYFTGEKKPLNMVLSLPFAVLAVSQEQSLAAFLFLYVFLLAACLVRKKNIVYFLLPLAIGVFFGVYLLRAPGVQNRMAFEGSDFESYSRMGIFGKLFCAAAVTFANVYGLSVFLALMFAALLLLAVYQSGHRYRSSCKGLFVAFSASVCVPLLAALGLQKAPPQVIVREAFLSGEYSAGFWVLFGGGVCATAILFAALVLLIQVKRQAGISVAVLAATAAGCALAMGFSSSIFASGQRVFFFTNMFLSMACCVLYATLQKGKLRQWLWRCGGVYACAGFTLNCIVFCITEHPLMG